MPRRKIPPLNALLAFEAAARHGSFTRAANEISVAQPAVTRHIAKLEDWIGAPLFIRRGNKVDLTNEGRILADLAVSTFDRLELGVRDVIATDDSELRVGASFGVTHLWLMPRISEMRAATNVTINFVTSDDYRNFDDHSVDVSIRFGNGSFGNHASDLLFHETCQIIASPDFLADHPEFDPNNPTETIDHKYLLDHGDPHQNGWVTWNTLFAGTDRSLLKGTRLRTVQSYPTMLDMICAGEGIGIGYWGLEDQLVQDGRIARVGDPIRRGGYGYYLVYREEMKAKQAFDKLRIFLIGG